MVIHNLPAFRIWPVLALAIAPTGALAQDEAKMALNRCIEIAGAPDAGVPVSRAAMADYLNALSRARPHCESAAQTDPRPPAPLFNLAAAQQRSGEHERAIANLEAAAEAGLAAARTKLGDYYNFGIGPVKEDHERAVGYYRAAAEAGDLPAMTTLALMYRLGRGVTQDHAQMIEWIERAAEGGYHFAQVRLAELSLDPKGIGRDDAAALGLPDPARAADLYARAGAQGNLSAMLELAGLYADDGKGVAADPERHAEWVKRAADTGAPQAQGALGLLYEQGRGVERDPTLAAKLYVRALASGDLPFAKLRSTGGARAPRWDRETAVEFQKILRERGLYRGALDGVVGPGTSAAARALGGD